jgi:TetR/AcrR family transcriptional repressor of nem operon
MLKLSNRDRLLAEGLHVVQELGFSGASVRDITKAANVSLGSFTSHFSSKEAFCIEILEIYFERVKGLIAETLRNDTLDPLSRIAMYFDRNESVIDANGIQNGCLIGNFSAESVEHSAAIRSRLIDIFVSMQASLKYCLDQAVAAGELAPIEDTDELAAYLVSSFQGAVLRAKVEHSVGPIRRFKNVVFSMLLIKKTT